MFLLKKKSSKKLFKLENTDLYIQSLKIGKRDVEYLKNKSETIIVNRSAGTNFEIGISEKQKFETCFSLKS